MPQEDVPAGEDESDGSEDSDSDDEEYSTDSSEDGDGDDEDEEKEDEPLSLDWPDTPRKQATYLILLPIIFPLWVTIPDVRNQVKTEKKRERILGETIHCFKLNLSNRNPENSSWSPSWAPFCGSLSSLT